MIKDRYQNPTIGDTVKLQLFSWNSNTFTNVDTISKIDIFFLDPGVATPANPLGKVLVQTIPGASVVNPSEGHYELDLFLDPGLYIDTGRYIDCWTIEFESGDPDSEIDQLFEVFPDLWYTSPIPVVYDFEFYFQPNKIRFGSKKFIEIEVIPNVPRATDLAAYYTNLIISANLKVFIALNCSECVPCENDLRVVVDGELTQFREKNRAFYFIDTTKFDCGVFDIWFELDFGGNVYVSPVNQLQIFN